MSIEFKNPPITRRGPKGSKHDPIADELRARPGEWALIASGAAASTAAAVKGGLIKAYKPAGTFEAVARGVKSGRGDIYARFVGGGES